MTDTDNHHVPFSINSPSCIFPVLPVFHSASRYLVAVSRTCTSICSSRSAVVVPSTLSSQNSRSTLLLTPEPWILSSRHHQHLSSRAIGAENDFYLPSTRQERQSSLYSRYGDVISSSWSLDPNMRSKIAIGIWGESRSVCVLTFGMMVHGSCRWPRAQSHMYCI